LKPTDYQDEKAVAAGMIWNEFHKTVTVKHCRRLGNKMTGRTQNMLVTLSSADDAAFLIRNAKMLRESRNDFVRSNIFINADLTPAEALAAYEARCVRRQRRAELQARSARTQTPELIETGDSVIGGVVCTTKPATATQTAESSHLDPTTPSFTPLLVTADVHNSAE